MAQGQLATMPLAGVHPSSIQLTKDDLHAIQQCEKIVQFRDAIMSGLHPRIKVPQHLSAQTASSLSSASSSNLPISASQSNGSVSQANNAGNFQSFISNAQHPIVPGLGIASSSTTAMAAKPFASSKTEINPIFLEKSEDLIKAEIQLQRQRLERALRDQVDQRRAAVKASAQIEPMADFDLSDVLSKALTLVQATAAPLPADANPAANTTAASDSFDENSYYSSQHNTPDSHQSSHVGNESQGVPVLDTSTSEQSLSQQMPAGANNKQPSVVQSSFSHHSTAHNLQQQHQTASIASFNQRGYPANVNPVTALLAEFTAIVQNTGSGEVNKHGDSTSGGGSGEASRSVESGNMDVDTSADRPVPVADQRRLRESLLARQPSPLVQVRAPNISPVAPQPSRVSPLAVARRPPVVEQDLRFSQGTPAQVAALRTGPTAISSPDSSPQGGRHSDKRKGKKKRNKKAADRQAPEAVTSPYIKPEPRSPSPMIAPAFARPPKRQRQSQRLVNQQSLDEHRYDPAASGIGQQDRYPSDAYSDTAVPVGYARPDEYHQRPVSRPVIPATQSYQMEYVEDRRVSGSAHYIQEPQSPGVYSVQHAPNEAHAMASLAPTDRHYREPPRFYRQEYEIAPLSARPEAVRARSRSPVMRDGRESAMGPPKAPPAQVVVDPYGRRYYEPQPPTVIRQSIAPPMRLGEPEIIYERAPLRPQSIRPEHVTYEDDGVIYRRATSPYGAPRRVVTQPEYGAADHRVYRQREYSVRPVAPPGEEYIQVRSGGERRQVEVIPREYMTRATTARPAESIRYEVPREYGRMQSVRPDAPVRDYATTAHPESRREMVQPVAREYSVRPAESHVVRREYSVRPVEQYYGHAMRDDEIAFIEQPRAAPQEIVYAEDGRQIYR